jgi:deoxyribodipyrimidine photo-lyase
MDERRVKFYLKKKIDGPILYWMSRDQRLNDNWALIYAQEIALKHKQPLIVIFCLQSEFLDAGRRSFEFMLKGLKILANELKNLNIPFLLLKGRPYPLVKEFIEKFKIGILIIDFSPLKIKKKWVSSLKKQLKISFCEIDSHNIIPCWNASNKKEYAAYTIRPKIKKLLPEFLVDFPYIKRHPYKWNEEEHDIDVKELMKYLSIPNSNYKIEWIKPGEEQARKVLHSFLRGKIKQYDTERNDPNKNALSNLSPYLHFGQISSQRVVLEAVKLIPLKNLKGTFYDEIIVRKELSDNFCYYEPNYDNVDGFQDWALKTLKDHKIDRRDYLYTLKEFESANTHDNLWNAAQTQMVKTGKMHGYLRMYWGKKILEWTKCAEDAMNVAIYLNDKYELDGRDPNGYTGIAWSIGGVHDRAWKERGIFGKIRYMSHKGMKRKFNIQLYIEKFLS